MKRKMVVWLIIIALISSVFPTIYAEEETITISVNDINRAHPRLIVTSYNEITEKINLDDYTLGQYGKIKKTVDDALAKEADGYYMEGYSFSKIVTNAALCYRQEKDRKYIDGIMKHLYKPVYFEDVDTNYLHRGAEMSAMSFFYDWLYDVLTDMEKQHILKCLKAYLGVWKNAYEVNEGWTVRTMNMALINQSSGILAALAISDEEPELSDWFLKTAVSNISTKFGQFATGGGYDESIAYWVFVTEYLCSMLNALETSTGSTYGMTELPGFERTGSFYINMCGPTGLVDFRYGDGPEDRRAYGAPGLLYMAKKYNNPGYGYWGKYFCSRGSDERFPNTAMSIVMYDPAYCEFEPENMELDNTYPGSTEAGSMRSSWNEPKALQIAYKGGGTIEGHSQLEAGNFIINALEMRWIEDLGWESYSSADNFSGQLGRYNPRYTFFKNSAQGQNQFVINPTDAPPEQNPENHAPIIKNQSTADDSFSIVDLTPPYEDYVTKAHRGFRLYKGKQYMVVQDEVQLKETGDFWWFVNTSAGLQLSEDRRSVILFKDGQKLLMKMLSDNPEYKFTITAAEPLYFTPSRDDNQEITGIHRIAVNIPSVDEVKLSVVFIPIYDETTEQRVQALKYEPLENWGAKYEQDAELSSISIGGEKLLKFRPGVVNYFIEQKEDMKISYTANENAQVTVDVPKDEMWTTAEIHVAEEGKNPVTYSIHCSKGAKVSSSYEIPVENITASEAEERAFELIDEDMTTYWISQNDGCWVQLDFGKSTNIGALMIAFRYGAQRSHYFDLAVSEDGKDYTEIGSFVSGGFTDKGDIISFPEVKGRYLKITGHGNSQNDYNAAFDMRAYKNYENAEAALIERDGKYLSSFDVVMSHKDIIEGEAVKYTAIMTDNHYNEYKPKEMKITVLNENEEVVKVNTDNKTITGIKEGNAILKFVIESDGVMMSKKINITVSKDSTENIIASADTYVEAPAPEINRGTRQDMTVRGSSEGTFDRIGYMKFDISSIKDSVKKAYIFVYGYFTEDEESGSLPIGIYEMNPEWKEAEVTYKDDIQMGDKIGNVQFEFEKTWKKVDVTEYLKQMLTEDKKELSVAFYQDVSSPNNKIYTRESVYAPYLSYSLEQIPTIDEKLYTSQILKNPKQEIRISREGKIQMSGYLLGTAMRKNIPWVTVEKNKESFSIAPVVVKNLLNRESIYSLSMEEKAVDDLPVKAASILRGSRIVEIRVMRDGVLQSVFPKSGKIKLELSMGEEQIEELPEIYYLNPLNMEMEKIQDVKLLADNKIEINYTKPGIFAIK